MNRFLITVASQKGQTICNPPRVEIGPGDIVQWICQDADLALDFGNDTPFTSTEVWRAPRGQKTREAIVKPGQASGTIFQPTISLDGTMVAKSLGDFIVR